MSSYRGVPDGLQTSTATTRTTSRNSASSSVRPRPRRLISLVDDETNYDDSSSAAQQLSSSGISTTLPSELTPPRSRLATPSPHSSRGPSPLPMRHPSRATESRTLTGQSRARSSSGGVGVVGTNRAKSQEGSGAVADLLDASWSSLQSLASSVLGSDIGRTSSDATSNLRPRRKPSRSDTRATNASRTGAAAWGPSGQGRVEVGAGTSEERQALLQAKKREVLLLADADSNLAWKARHKRRVSTDQPDPTAVDPDQDEEALVYIHHVQPTDSITGVSIRYGCPLAVFRKANGFWPSDSIQSRKTVLLPVEACSVKGRPLRPSQDLDLLSGGDHTGKRLSEYLNGSTIVPVSVSPEPELLTAQSSQEGDRSWKHESWVQIDGFQAAVEIGRVPRTTLGFFPRSRRKSIPYSDMEPPSPRPSRPEHLGSPVRSIDSPRSSRAVSAADESQTDAMVANRSTSRPRGHQRQRSFLLAGPGVGSLDRTVKAPGPAPDGLNKFFAQHLPKLAAPAPPPQSHSATLQRTSFESTSTATSNPSSGLDNLGGVLEGWVRKVATRAKASLNDLQQGVGVGAQSPQGQLRSSGLGAGIAGIGMGDGDLIELDDGLDVRDSSGGIGAGNGVEVGGGPGAGLLDIPRRANRETARSKSIGHTTSAVRSSGPVSGSLTSRSRAPPPPPVVGDRFKDD